MWQHIHDPTAFVARARPILQLYGQARALLASGTWLVCVDEKTSIQAREAEQAPRATIRRHAQRQSPRYTRRGARHVIAGLSVADGQVLGQCSERKRFVDFQSFISDTVVPEARRRGVQRIGLILDNGPTHAPKQLERWLQEQAAAQGWGLVFQVHWLPTNASWLDQIEIWFSILQRKLLQPNHFGSLAALEQAIAQFITRYNQNAKPIKWTYTVEKLEQKLGTRL
jgi:transposase